MSTDDAWSAPITEPGRREGWPTLPSGSRPLSDSPHRTVRPSSRTWLVIAFALIVAAGVLLGARALIWGISFKTWGSVAVSSLALLLTSAACGAALASAVSRRREWCEGYSTIARDQRRHPHLWVLANDGSVVRPPTSSRLRERGP